MAPWVEFLEDRQVQDTEGRLFKKGEVVELPPASVDRWVRRGAAKEIDAPKRGGAKQAAPEKKDPDADKPPRSGKPEKKDPASKEDGGEAVTS